MGEVISGMREGQKGVFYPLPVLPAYSESNREKYEDGMDSHPGLPEYS